MQHRNLSRFRFTGASAVAGAVGVVPHVEDITSNRFPIEDVR